jgi:hypothetical protein
MGRAGFFTGGKPKRLLDGAAIGCFTVNGVDTRLVRPNRATGLVASFVDECLASVV